MKDLHNAPDELLTALLDNIPAHYDDEHKEHAAFVLEKNWQWVEYGESAVERAPPQKMR